MPKLVDKKVKIVVMGNFLAKHKRYKMSFFQNASA